jgi:hypothetical protein
MPDELRFASADTSKAQRELGDDPKLSFDAAAGQVVYRLGESA